MKESERFREFAEKFVLARAPDGTEGVWQAVLDAKTAYKQIVLATEEYAIPEREALSRVREDQQKFMEMTRKAYEQRMIKRGDSVEVPKEVFDKIQPEDRASWLQRFVEQSLYQFTPKQRQRLGLKKPLDQSSRKT